MTRKKRVAIVSPYFPPSNLAGVHRARLLSTHLPTYSWEPVVVCVHERHHEQTPDPQLARLVPDSVRVLKSGAIPSAATRLVGIGDIGIRAFWHLKQTVSNLLSEGRVDLLFITTSPYYNALSGPRLKKKFGIPLVIDFQDPWVSRWGATLPAFSKGGISHRLATWLEPRVIRCADHVTSVSEGTNDEIYARYPALPAAALSAMPIGGEIGDFEFLKDHPVATDELGVRDGEFHFSYVGTMWPRGYPALRALLLGLAQMRDGYPDLYRKLRLNFIGTSAQPDDTRNFHVMAHAAEFGVSERITEIPQRLGYLKGLNILANANAILVIGSDESHYTASKLHPSFLAGRPLLAILHENSSACDMIRRVGGGILVTFTERDEPAELASRVRSAMLKIIRDPDGLPQYDPQGLAPLSADSVAQQYAELFDRLVANGCRQPWW